MFNFPVFPNIGRLTTSKCDLRPISQHLALSGDNLPKRNVVALPGPKTQKERWAWLVSDAQRILRSPLNHRAEEVSWARDVIASEDRVSLKGRR
jgi:hypothetical protein